MNESHTADHAPTRARAAGMSASATGSAPARRRSVSERTAHGGETMWSALVRTSCGPPIELVDETGARTISRDELLVRAEQIARGLACRGVGPGDRVLSLLPTGVDFVTTAAATWRLGATIAAAPSPRKGASLDRLRQMVELVRPTLIVARRRELQAIDSFTDEVATAEPTELSGSGPLDTAPSNAADTAFLQFTSGTTSSLRAAMISHRALLSNAAAVKRRARVGHDDSMVSWLPLFHDMGFVGALVYPLLWEIPACLIATSRFLRDPSSWLHAVSDRRATITPSATFAYELLARRVGDARLDGIDLSSLRIAWVGAEPIFPSVLRDFEQRFRSKGLSLTALCPAYGMAEATLAVTCVAPGDRYRELSISRRALREDGEVVDGAPGGDDTWSLVGNGTRVQGTEARVVDDGGCELSERHEGRIQLRGPSMMRGYFAESATLDDGDWFDTGDLGFFDRDELYVTGRRKHLLIRGGVKHRAEEIEDTARTVARLGRVAAVAVRDAALGRERNVLLVEARAGCELEQLDRGVLLETITRMTGLVLDDIRIVARGSLPATSSGKLMRRACAALVSREENSTC